MKENYHYATVTEAISNLRKEGFSVDFNIVDNWIAYHSGKFDTDEFDIVEVYRYEGESDPGDEAVVYAIESTSGIKGILVAGYGASSDSISTKMLQKLAMRA